VQLDTPLGHPARPRMGDRDREMRAGDPGSATRIRPHHNAGVSEYRPVYVHWSINDVLVEYILYARTCLR
jgi:hypothetical protein